MAMTLGSVATAVLVALVVHRSMGGSRDTRSGYAKAVVRSLGYKVQLFKQDVGRFPRNLDELTMESAAPGAQGPYSRVDDLVDPWKRPYYYRTWDKTFTVFTLGEDGRPGGAGEAVDQQYDPSQRD